MKWELLDKAKMTVFVDSVKTTGEAVLFNPVSSEVKCTTLPFYRNILLYRMTNFASMPMMSFNYLGDGNRYFYLDGTEIPLITVNHTGALQLTATNIIAYLNFYFFAVQHADGEIFLVPDPSTYPFQEDMSFDISAGFSIGQHNNYEITEESDGGFLVETPLFMDGTLVRAQLRIDPTGRVNILSQRIMINEGASTLTPKAGLYE